MSTSSTKTSTHVSQNLRTRTGCQNCRLRHLRCDDRRPACAKCEKAGIECMRGFNVRFRHGANPSVANSKGSGLARTDFDFSKKQPWVKTARTLTFLDETRELMSLYDHDQDDTVIQPAPSPSTKDDTCSRSSPIALSSTIQSPPAVVTPSERPKSAGAATLDDVFPRSPSKRRRFTFDDEHPFSSLPLPRSPVSRLQASSVSSWQTRWTVSDLGTGTSNPTVDLPFATYPSVGSPKQSRIYLEAPVWPLNEREEAMLLRYFVENLARNFDLTDPQQHFRLVVPQRAGTCPILLSAILALSARHLSRVTKYDPLISDRYHQECLQHLIPMLDDNAAILDENLLASTIILRHLEEFEVPVSGQHITDQQSHLLGAQAFITAQERATIAGGLRQAAFWVGLRQEVYVAFVNQRSIMPALEHCNIDRSFEPAEDHIWTCRMVVLCADVIRYCFGDNAHSTATYQFLADSVAEWDRRKPASFKPIYYRAASSAPRITTTSTTTTTTSTAAATSGPSPTSTTDDADIFPDLWFVSDVYTTGLQHYHLARILLSAHDPRVPRLGPGRQSALRAMDAEICAHVLALCGICRSNPGTAANFCYASMAVTMAGDKFAARRQQDALLTVLVQCDYQHGWPTHEAQRNLKIAWGWGDEVVEGD